MRRVLIIIFLVLLEGQAWGATYYVDTAADPSGDGTTQDLTGANCAWDTVADVNAASFSVGDSVLFKQGDTWASEELFPPSTGSDGNPITFGTYGTGAAPIIGGMTIFDLPNTGQADLYDNFDDNDITDWGMTGTVLCQNQRVEITKDATSQYITQAVTERTEHWMYFKIYFDSLSIDSSGSKVFLGGIFDSGSLRVSVNAHRVGGNILWAVEYRKDAATQTQVDSSTVITSGVWHEVVVQFKAATGVGANDGIGKLWVDGTPLISVTNIDNDTFVSDQALLGIFWSQASTVVMYFDDIRIGAATPRNYLTFQGIDFQDEVYIADRNNLNFNYCLLRNSSTYGVRLIGAYSAVQFNNCGIINNHLSGLSAYNTGSVVLRNCIVFGNAIDAPFTYGVLDSTSGTFDYDYNLFTGNCFYPAYNTSFTGATDGGHNLTQIIPEVNSYSNDNAYFVLSIDDHAVEYVDNIVAAISANHKITFFANPANITGGEQTNLATLSSAGHEVSVHGWSHTDLGLTTAFAITSTNTNPTCDVDVATTTISLSCDEGGNVVNYDWSGDKTITDLKAAVAGKGWTITNTTYVFDALKLDSLDDTAGAQAVPYTCNLDITAPDYAFWREEIDDNVTWLTAVTGVTPTTVGYPYGTTSANLITYIKNVSGLEGARIAGSGGQYLSSVPIYQVGAIYGPSLDDAGADEAGMRAAARHVATFGKSAGGVYVIYVHTAADLSVNQIIWFADELANNGVYFQTFASVITAIRASHSTVDDLTYTKTYADLSDFTLLPNSPAIDTGANLGQAYDQGLNPRNPLSWSYLNNSDTLDQDLYGSGWEIGAYVYDGHYPIIKHGNYPMLKLHGPIR